MDWLLLTFPHPKKKKTARSINSTFRNKIISNLTGDKQKGNKWKMKGDELETGDKVDPAI